MISIKEINITKNSIPADALISRAFKTGMLYPFTSFPKAIILFISLPFLRSHKLRTDIYLVTLKKETNCARLTSGLA